MPPKKYILGIETPARRKASGDNFYVDLEAVAYWIKNLPRGSIGQTAQQIYTELKQRNKTELDYEDRVDYLELIREPLYYTTSAMEKYFVGVNFPLSKKQQKIAAASSEFYLLIASGYIIAIEALLEQSDSPLKEKCLCLLIHRAITYLSRAILTSYQVYASITKDLWAKLHKLFLFAETHDLDQIPISDDQHQYISKTTSNGEYTRVLFLSLASPYHLRHGEIGKVYINLERWIDRITLGSLGDTPARSDAFAVDLQRDNPPGYLEFVRQKADLGTCRIFHADSLLDELDLELQRSEIITSNTLISANLGDAGLSHDLLRRLKKSWGSVRSRAHKRIEANQKVNPIIGISAIHRLVRRLPAQRQYDNKNNPLLPENPSQGFDNNANHDTSGIEVRCEHWGDANLESGGGDAETKENENYGSGKQVKLEKGNGVNSESWTLVNESESGFCLQCDGGCAQQVQVGEIIGLQRSKTNYLSEISIAIIRWMKVYGQTGIRFGALIISPTATPIKIRLLAKDIENNHKQRALLLSAEGRTGSNSSILTFATPYRSGCNVYVTIYGHDIPVRLTKKVENSGLYNRFEYEHLVPRKHRTKAAVTANSGNSEFDDIWSSI